MIYNDAYSIFAGGRHPSRLGIKVRDLLVTLGPDSIFREVSPAWTVTLGHPPTKIVERSFLDFIHPEDAGVTRGSLGTDSRRDLTSFEKRYLHRDGSALDLLAHLDRRRPGVRLWP